MKVNHRRPKFIPVLVFAMLLMGTIYTSTNIYQVASATTSPSSTKSIPVYEVSTRQNLNTLQGESFGYNNHPLENITGLLKNCSEQEVIIVVHGWGINEAKAKERFDRVKLSLENNSYYNTSLVGFSWKSDLIWSEAKKTANDNGATLAKFIFDLINTCKQEFGKDIKVRLIGHSLGARVILSSLNNLLKNLYWKNNNYTIASVNLLGATVDNEEVSKFKRDIDIDGTNWNSIKTNYGQAIEQVVKDFYNYYNPEDNAFQIYPSYEGDWALGQTGYQTTPFNIVQSLPANYHQTNVQDEIPPSCDADGDKEPDFPLATNMIIARGDNHGGYFGFRDTENDTRLVDDGAMNVVVDNWSRIKSEIKESLQQSLMCK
jgi:esterase/lipase superfamily enzyme